MTHQVLNQWMITGVFDFCLVGYVDGVKITTSPICDVIDDAFITTNGNGYVLGTVDHVFDATCPNAKQRLKETINSLKEIVY